MTQELLKNLGTMILEVISQPIVVSDDLSRFLDSFCNVTCARELQLLMDEDADELCVFYEMVFFPSFTVQESLETTLKNGFFQERDLPVLYCEIEKQYTGTPLIFPDNTTITLSPPKEILHKYLERLHLTKRLPAMLTDAINASIYEGFKNTARVILRNSAITFQPTDNHFLCRVIIRFGFDVQNIDPVYRFAVKTIEENHRGISYKELLLARRQAYTELKTRVRNLRTTLEKTTVESIMMQGIAIPSQPVETIDETVRVIDLLLGCMED